MAYCKVKNCRFSRYHLSEAHQCGLCKKFGHGQIECANNKLIENITHLSKNISLPENLYCKAPFCESPNTHLSESHQCSNCDDRHFEINCKIPVHLTSKFYAQCQAAQTLGSADGKIFIDIYAGMGCQWFIKRDSVNSKSEFFFMHTDAWGQYGPQCDDTEKLKKFLEGYVHLETGKEFSFVKIE